jgi:uncharacterized protein (DUF342 family)
MKENTDYTTQDLVAASETLLEDVDGAEQIMVEPPTEAMELKVRSEILKRFVIDEEDSPRDGYVEINVSEDEMEATADFFAPSGGGQMLGPDEVSRSLEAQGVVFGADWEAIKEALFRCNTERIDILDVCVARGVKPVDQLPEHLVIEERLLRGEKKEREASGRIDFRDSGMLVIVKKDEPLARLVPEEPGREGYTIFGRALPYKKAKVSLMKPGKNTRLSGDRAVAECDGRFQFNQSSFWVNEILDISGDVDYRTGHVDFPGDVYIRGEIKAGFRVYAGGSVYCLKTLDASEILCAQDLTVGWGLIGRKAGKVKVGGELRAKFIENCYVEAKGSIYVEVGILNSVVYTSDRVETGKKGVIAGGSVTAQNGIQVVQLGTRMGPRTELYCGTDYVTEQKLEWIRNKNLELAFKLKQVDNRIKKAEGNHAKLLEVQTRMREAIHKLNEAAQSLVFQLDRNEAAEIIVSGYVYPGTYIEICHVSFVVGRMLKAVKFRLDKEKGKVLADQLLS